MKENWRAGYFRGYTGKYHEHGYTRDRVGGSKNGK